MSEVSSSRFCHVTAQMAHYCKDKVRWGSAYRKHWLFIQVGRYIFLNRWNTNDYCSLFVVPEGACNLADKRLCDHSTGSCGSGCRPWVEPEWIVVYDDGRFKAEGPWEEDLPKMLDEMEATVKAAYEQREAERTLKVEQHEEEQKRRFAVARETVERTKDTKLL